MNQEKNFSTSKQKNWKRGGEILPSKKKAEEKKRKMSASNRQSRLRDGKSAKIFDQQRARQGKKSSSAEKKPQRGGNPHLRRHPIRIHIYSHIPMHPHKTKDGPTFGCRLRKFFTNFSFSFKTAPHLIFLRFPTEASVPPQRKPPFPHQNSPRYCPRKPRS